MNLLPTFGQKSKNFLLPTYFFHGIKAFKKAIKLSPNDKASWINLGILHKKRGEYEEALKCVREAIKIDPNDKKSWYLEASILYLMNRDSEALKAVNKALEFDANYEGALVLKRDIAKRLKKYDDLIEACAGLLDLGHKDVDIMYDLAEAYFFTGNLDKALEFSSEILKTLPRHLPTLRLQKEIMKKQEKWERVIAICEEILKIDPKNVEALLDESLAYRKLDKLESALNFAIRASEIDSTNIDIWKLRKNLAKELNKPQEIITASKQILSMEEDFETYRDLAKAYYIISRYDDAKKTMEKGLRLNNEDDEGWNLMGMIYYKLGDLENARYSFERATELNPKKKKYWSNLAWTMEKLEKFDDAIKYFDKALELDPQDLRLWYERGICLKNMGKYDDALKSFNAALDIDPKFTKALFEKGDVLILMDKLKEALKIFNSLLELEPTNPEYLYKRALIRFKKREFEAALKDLEVALTYEKMEKYLELKKDVCKALKDSNCIIKTSREILSINKKNLVAWRDLGSSYESIGKIDSAIATYKEALEIFPDNKILLYELKDLLLKHERFADAVEICKNILAISPEDPQNLKDLGLALFNLKKYEEAKQYLVRSAEINKNWEIMELLGDTYYKLKNYEDSIEAYREAINLGGPPIIYYKLAKTYYKVENFNEALKALKKAIEWEKRPSFYILASRIYLKKGNSKSALKYAKKAYELEDTPESRMNLATIMFELNKYADVINLLKPLAKENDIQALRLLAKSLEKEKRYEDAAKTYQRIVDIEKKDAKSWAGLGRCYLALKEFEKAIKAYERAHLIEPENKEIYESLSFAYESLGKYKKALEYLDGALSIEPEDAHLWTSKGLLLLKMNRLDEAIECFNKALEINPNLTSAKEGKMECERLLEERMLEEYAKKVLLLEYKKGKRVTKKEAFKQLNIPLNIITKVFNYIKTPEPLDISKLSPEEIAKFDKATLKLAKNLKKIENVTLPEIIGNSELDVKSAKRLLAYINKCLESPIVESPTKDDELLLRRALDMDLKNFSLLNLMMNLNIGLCKAKLLQKLLMELSDEEEIEVGEVVEEEELEELEEEENEEEEESERKEELFL
jgi:tetratricopeptide (TPR) repeat protein